MAVQRSDVAAAREQYAALKPGQGTMPAFVISNDRLLGLLAGTMGQLDLALAHFEDGVTFSRRAGYRPELAWECYEYADALIQRASSPVRGEPFGRLRAGSVEPRPSTSFRAEAPSGLSPLGRSLEAEGSGRTEDDRAKAMRLLDEALTISRELGMRPLMEKVVSLQEKAESLPVEAPAYPDGLSQREVEVLRLIALGKSNPEIGKDLFISLNTVARHVSHIFSKTGAANRTEAATYAVRHELIQD